jgi:hypothetical protein
MAKEIYYWEANDGTKFPTEDECVAYEIRQKAKAFDGKLMVFDEWGDEMPFGEIEPDQVYAFVVKTQEAADFFADWIKDAYWKPWSRPSEVKPGNYIFIHETWWRDKDYREYVNEKLKIFEKRG